MIQAIMLIKLHPGWIS